MSGRCGASPLCHALPPFDPRVVALLLLPVVASACGSERRENQPEPAPASVEPPGASTRGGFPYAAAPSPFPAAVATGRLEAPPRVGVPACDRYFELMFLCLRKLPPDLRTTIEAGVKMNRDAWTTAAASPVTRSKLESACEDVLSIARISYRSLGCDM